MQKIRQRPVHAPGTPSANMSPAEFREVGHRLIEQIAGFYESLPTRNLAATKSRSEIRNMLGAGGLPARGTPAADLLGEVAPLLFDHSLHNGHPGFLGYISASGAPLGALADLLAAAVNPNLVKWDLSPVASEIEGQTIRWLAELMGYPADCGGLMVSGGNAANLHAFIAARHAAADWDLRKQGLYGDQRKLTAYVSKETHTWVEKAAETCGLGADAVRWIETDDRQRMCVDALSRQVEKDRRNGFLPFIVVGTAGTVGTGTIDPIRDMAAFCSQQGIWFHVDGAYGAPAASLPEAPDDLHALVLADSVAVDPHKWLYSPLEAACILTRDPNALRAAFDFRPDYYQLADDEECGVDYYQHGLQNSRGFRALKVWLGLRRAGSDGCRASIRRDISLARYLHRLLDENSDFEVRALNLSIVSFRYMPDDLVISGNAVSDYVNELNRKLLVAIQDSGQAFVSNAIIDGDYLLRACVVNFRTTESDLDAVAKLVRRLGESLDKRLRPQDLGGKPPVAQII